MISGGISLCASRNTWASILTGAACEAEIWELISTILSALVAGMFCGPWLALTRFIRTTEH